MSVWVLRYEKETKKFKKRVLTFLSFKYPSFFLFLFFPFGSVMGRGGTLKNGQGKHYCSGPYHAVLCRNRDQARPGNSKLC